MYISIINISIINNLLTGETDNVNPPFADNDFQSASLPLGATIPPKVQSKIWADQFVDLRILLKDNDDEEYTFTLNKQLGKSSVSVMSPTQRSKPLEEIQEWTAAMLTFGAIYTERHPHTAPKLFKYIKTVRDMEARGGNWTYYDTQFRKLKAQRNWSWDFTHWELHFNAMAQTTASKRQINSRFGKDKKFPKYQPFLVPNGFCWGFHRAGKCDNTSPCPYKHLCFKCKSQNHPAKWCRHRDQIQEKFTANKAKSTTANPSKRP